MACFTRDLVGVAGDDATARCGELGEVLRKQPPPEVGGDHLRQRVLERGLLAITAADPPLGGTSNQAVGPTFGAKDDAIAALLEKDARSARRYRLLGRGRGDLGGWVTVHDALIS